MNENISSLLATSAAIVATIAAYMAYRDARSAAMTCEREIAIAESALASILAIRSASLKASQAGAAFNKSEFEFSGSSRSFLTSASPSFSYSSSNSMGDESSNFDISGKTAD